MIVSKMNRMVLACIESDIVIQERRGDESQKWLQHNSTIVSSKYQSVICVKGPENVPVCVKKASGHGYHLCCLQSGVSVTTSQLLADYKTNPLYLIVTRNGIT